MRWCPRGLSPKSSQSSMWEKSVSGCQLEATSAVIAQATPSPEIPDWTRGLPVT